MSRYAELSDVLTPEELQQVFPEGNPEQEVENTILGLEGDNYVNEGGISLNPFIDPKGQLLWELYIPATTFTDVDEEGIPNAPYGATYWNTLLGAISSLALTHRQGLIKFNDGRVVK